MGCRGGPVRKLVRKDKMEVMIQRKYNVLISHQAV